MFGDSIERAKTSGRGYQEAKAHSALSLEMVSSPGLEWEEGKGNHS